MECRSIERCVHTIELKYFEIFFETAWSAPVPVFLYLREMFPKLSFNCRWKYEDDDPYPNSLDESIREIGSPVSVCVEQVLETLLSGTWRAITLLAFAFALCRPVTILPNRDSRSEASTPHTAARAALLYSRQGAERDRPAQGTYSRQ
jgi:hypothetical protein